MLIGVDAGGSRTTAAVADRGGRMLARWLSAPLLELDSIRARQDAVARLIAQSLTDQKG